MKFKTKDTDVIKFITTAGITGGTEFSAVNYLVLALKTNNLWNRIFAIYPFVGGTATTHKYNLKNPVDSNAGFRLTFSGSVTHDSNGVTYSPVNGCSNTFLTPSTTITLNRETMALYSRTSAAATGSTDMGSAVSITQRDEFVVRSNINDGAGANFNSTTVGAGSISYTGNTDGNGFYMASRQTSTDGKAYRNGILMASATTLNNGTRSNIPVYIGCRNVLNSPQNFTGRNFGLAVIAAQYTPAEAVIWNDIAQQYNLMLNRKV